MLNILFSAKLSYQDKERLQENYPEQSFTFCENMNEAKKYLEEADILVTYGEDLTSELVTQAVKLKWIMVLSAGMDRMPFETIEQRGILVTNARGIHKIPMAEYAISMLLQVYRQEKLLMQLEAEQKWGRSHINIGEISGKTLLVLGTGAIGQEVARLAKAFQMTTYGISRSGRTVANFDENYTTDELEKLLPEADFVVSVLPSTEETRGLLTYEHFQLLPDHAVFLNMGRGDLVSSEDILKAVQQQEIAHAVLDVFEEEPLPADHPIWQEENITITPHTSGVSKHYLTRALEIFEENLHIYLGDQKHYVNEVDVT
ncbi:MAG TPA: D-2-hydroxyacid dehydrogenase, partial [Virgibacillus sp.]|nr:D-2-hydroxyacid dehydrogenase [Virgibacillus sp.]